MRILYYGAAFVVVVVLGGGVLLCYVFLDAWAFLWLWKAEATPQLQCMGFSLQWPLVAEHRLNGCVPWAYLLHCI